MPLIRLPQPYTNTFAANNVRDALMTMGEETIVLSAYHISVDLNIQPRCRNFNDTYSQEDHWRCERCFGTTFEGGIKTIARAWAIFTDHPLDEKYTRTGEWTPDDRSVQIENFPTILRHDFIVRVKSWDNRHAPLEFGDRYIIDDVRELTLRTGNRYGQQHTLDCYGQQSRIHRLPENHPIFRLSIPIKVPVARIGEVISMTPSL